jgi:MFS family permease
MEQTRDRHLGWLLAVLLTGQFMTTVDTTIVNVATPSIHDSLRASGGELQLVVSGYILAYAMLLITGARIGDTRGYRRVFLVGLTVFTVASLACGLAPNVITLILARIAQGVGAAIMVPQVLTGIQLHFSGKERGRALGLYVVALSGGAVAGQILGGVLVSANLLGTTWRPIFLINVPIGVVLLAAAVRYLPVDQGGRDRRLDLLGVGTLSAAVLLLVLPLVLGHDQGWPTWVWISLAASVLAFAAFIVVERAVAAHGGYPLVNLHVLTKPPVAWGLLSQAAAQVTYLSILFVLALYLQQGLGKSPLYSGLALVSWVAAFGLAGYILRRLPTGIKSHTGPIGYLLLAAAYLGISLSLSAEHATGALLITLLGIGGFGLGTGFSSLIGHITNSVPTRYAPDISGVHTTILQVTGVLGIATFGTLYLALGTAGHQEVPVAVHAFDVTTAGLAAVALVAAVTAFLSTHQRATASEQNAEPAALKDQSKTMATSSDDDA